MLITKLEIIKENADVEELELVIKDNPQEITLLDFVKFQNVIENLPENIKPIFAAETEQEQDIALSQWDEMDLAQYFFEIGKLLRFFVYIDVGDDILRASIEDILNMPPTGEDSLSALFMYVFDRIMKYKPTERKTFKHKGQVFQIPTSIAIGSNFKLFGAKMSSIEAIEALQLQHVYSDKKGADARYNSVIGVMAAICRKVDNKGNLEDMPLDSTERRAFMQERMDFFQDMPMDIALDVDFFLSNSNPVWKSTRSLARYLMSLTQKVQSK